jgi:hypothetical protein
MPSVLTPHLAARGLRALVGSRWELPYALPPGGARLRLAFVGQSTYFQACALGDECEEIETSFVDFRAGADSTAMLTALAAFDPHVVVAFRPEILPAGVLDALERAATIGFLTEPLPRLSDDAHADLERRLDDLKATDAGNFDRLITFDPLIASSADAYAPVWRSLPLPVADLFYAPVRPSGPKPGVLFIGRSTPHREDYLVGAKHEFDILHVAHGVDGPRLHELLAQHEVGINLHNEPYPSFENRVCLHLAAGHLVLSEPLSPTHGLEPGIDFVEVRQPRDLHHAIWTVRRHPRAYDRIRYRGRAKAEHYRASRVYPRLLHDLYLDLGAFGTGRRTVRG